MGLLLQHDADVNLPSNKRLTPLYFAIIKENYPVVKQLVQDGANVNYANGNGQTPLFVASSNGYTAIVQYLLVHGADPNINDNTGNTPLMAAVSGDHKMVAQLLIEHGADIGALSKEGTTAEDIARKNANTQIIALFKGDAISQNAKSRPMKIVLRPTIGTVNDKALEKGSLRGWELRTAQGQFLDMLSETDLFASVDATDAEARADAQSGQLAGLTEAGKRGPGREIRAR